MQYTAQLITLPWVIASSLSMTRRHSSTVCSLKSDSGTAWFDSLQLGMFLTILYFFQRNERHLLSLRGPPGNVDRGSDEESHLDNMSDSPSLCPQTATRAYCLLSDDHED